jgi:hypothetical protein
MNRIEINRNNCGNYIRWYYNGYHYFHFSQASEKIVTSGKPFATEAKKVKSVSSLGVDLPKATALHSLMLTKDAQLYKDGQWIDIRVLPGTQVIYRPSVNGYEMKLDFECSI